MWSYSIAEPRRKLRMLGENASMPQRLHSPDGVYADLRWMPSVAIDDNEHTDSSVAAVAVARDARNKGRTIWKNAYSSSGMRGEPGEGSPSAFWRPKRVRSPM